MYFSVNPPIKNKDIDIGKSIWLDKNTVTDIKVTDMKKKTQTETEPLSVPTDYCCPLCDKPLYRRWGNSVNPDNKEFGVQLFCIHGDPDAKFHPQDVSGHGFGRSDEAMLQRAYQIILAKFCGGKLPQEG
jgi:hypothetical protein